MARLKAQLTQQELATGAGVSQQAISAYETGRKDPSTATLRRLLVAAGYEIRIHLEPIDDHDEGLKNYMASLPPDLQKELQQRQLSRLERARLERVRGN